MPFDERARRAAADLQDALRQARFTVRSPATMSRVSWPAVAAATVAVAVVIGAPLLWIADRDNPVPVGGLPTTTLAPTTEATATTSAVRRTPAATSEELVTALYTALDSRDTDALGAVSSASARHSMYFADADSAGIDSTFGRDGYRIGDDRILEIEITGAAIESGNTVTLPVRYRFSGASAVYEGFDVLVLVKTPDGLLVAGSASFLGDPGVTIDPAASAVIEIERTAWNRNDRDGVLAVFADDGALWDDLADPDATFTGDDLWTFVGGSLWFDVEFATEPVTSGPFLAVPTRLVAAGDTSEGVTIYFVRDARIVLQAFAQ